MNERKITAIIAATALFLTLFGGCSNNSSSESSSESDKPSAEEEYLNTIQTISKAHSQAFAQLSKDDISFEGDPSAIYTQPCTEKFDTIPDNLSKLVSEDDFRAYSEKMQANFSEYKTTDLSDYLNLYSFLEYFDLSDEVFRQALVDARNTYTQIEDSTGMDMSLYKLSDEEIDLILSRNEADIAEYFKSSYSITVGNSIYSMSWVYNSTIEDYVSNNIPPALLLSVNPDRNMSQSELERYPAKSALLNKLNDYTKASSDTFGDIMTDIEIDGMNLSEPTSKAAGELEISGVTANELSALLDEIKDYSFTPEYKYIQTTIEAIE